MSIPDGLRKMADFLEQHPEWEDTFAGDLRSTLGFVRKSDADEAKQALSEFVDAGLESTGRVEKRTSGDTYYGCTVSFDEDVALELLVNREQVCTSRVVGQRTVTKRQMPDREEWPQVEVEEDVIEWDCAPLRKVEG